MNPTSHYRKVASLWRCGLCFYHLVFRCSLIRVSNIVHTEQKIKSITFTNSKNSLLPSNFYCCLTNPVSKLLLLQFSSCFHNPLSIFNKDKLLHISQYNHWPPYLQPLRSQQQHHHMHSTHHSIQPSTQFTPMKKYILVRVAFFPQV